MKIEYVIQKSILFFLLITSSFSFGVTEGIERVILFTDRNLYISNEDILFTATIFPKTETKKDFSTVLYIELITSEGVSFEKLKFPIYNNTCNGKFHLPKNILTGNYYLKAYTKWMRNYNPEIYSYTLIKIVNPFKKEILNVDSKIITSTTSIDSTIINSKEIDIILSKELYKTREDISFSIEMPKNLKKELIAMNVTIIPNGTYLNTITNKDIKTFQNKEIEYSPETKGVSLSGKVLSSKTNQPIKNIRVNLSIIGNNDIITQFSDSLGKFNFGFLDFYQSKDLFISAENKENENPKLLIDNDFCNKEIALPNYPFVLSKKENNLIIKMTQNLQVDSIFNFKETTTINNETINTIPFYGNPTKSLYFDNYILLPTIDEYFTEFIGDVTIKRKNGRRYFKIQGDHPSMQRYDPLVIIDFIAIENHELLLSINPQSISHVEIINKPYIKGSATFGGIISFISKKKNFAGIELPKSGVFINYDFYSHANNSVLTSTNIDSSPDTRNTLSWKNFTKTDILKNNQFLFKASDTPCEYNIIVRCADNEGNIHFSCKTITILDNIIAK